MTIKSLLLCGVVPALLIAADAPKFDYRVLATTKTSTMEKELNRAAQDGFVFSGVMGGESAFGGKEVLVVMNKRADTQAPEPRSYKLLATSKTSTLQKELNQMGSEGFDYCGQTVFESSLGGKETAVILEKTPGPAGRQVEYKVLATSKTSTMEKELKRAGEEGYLFQGVMVGKTAFGGSEVITVMKRYSN